jgi:hypothetical protein
MPFRWQQPYDAIIAADVDQGSRGESQPSLRKTAVVDSASIFPLSVFPVEGERGLLTACLLLFQRFEVCWQCRLWWSLLLTKGFD